MDKSFRDRVHHEESKGEEQEAASGLTEPRGAQAALFRAKETDAEKQLRDLSKLWRHCGLLHPTVEKLNNPRIQ